MEELIKIEWSGQLVMTTNQLSAVYKCKPKNIYANYSNAKEYFREGVHYFKLTGEALRQLKRDTKRLGVAAIPVNLTLIYLWTYQGCLRHCKMLNTPEAWKMFSELERVYFAVKEADKLAPPVQQPLFPEEDMPKRLVRNEKEEEVMRLRKQLSKVEKMEFAVVYALLMGDGTVKIGYSKDLTERAKSIKADTKLDVLQFCSTPFMLAEDAERLEAELHEKYAACRLNGEFFDVRFVDVCKDLKAMTN